LRPKWYDILCRQCSSSAVWRYSSTSVRQCMSVAVQQYSSATVRQYSSAAVRQEMCLQPATGCEAAKLS
jgi:hypothetical protein